MRLFRRDRPRNAFDVVHESAGRTRGSDPGELQRFLDELCAEGLFATGAQVAVVDLAAGVTSLVAGQNVAGVDLSAGHLFNTWCLTKPLLSSLFLAAAGERGVGPDSLVGDVVDVAAPLRWVSWGDVCNHSAGLTHPSMLEVQLEPERERNEWFAAARPTGGPGYSEFVASALMSSAVRSMLGLSMEALIAMFVSAHGLDEEICVDLSWERLAHPLERIGFFAAGLPRQPVPLYHDAIASRALDRSAVHGVYTTAFGVAQFYSLIGRVLAGERVELLPSPLVLDTWLAHNRGFRWDPVLDRHCDFAGGFMVDLAGHNFGKLSARAVGHSGFGGASYGFYEPDARVGVAVILNGLADNAADIDFLRPTITARILDAVT